MSSPFLKPNSIEVHMPSESQMSAQSIHNLFIGRVYPICCSHRTVEYVN